MFAYFVSFNGICTPRAIIREVSDVTPVDGLTLVRCSSDGKLRALAEFEHLAPTIGDARRAAADEIDAIAAMYSSEANKLRAVAAEEVACV